MPSPTLVSYTQTTWDTTGYTGNAKVSSSVSWNANDIVIVIVAQENAGQGTRPAPTGTGLSFSFVTGNNPGSDSSSCMSGIWTANPGSGGSSAITEDFGGTTTNSGFGVWVFRSSQGVGNSSEQHTSGKTVSLTPTAADGAIVWAVFDWGAGASPVGSPSPTDTREAAQIGGGAYTALVVDLTDQPSAGAVSYGLTGGSASGPFSIVVLEIKAAAGGGGTPAATTTTYYVGIFSKDLSLNTGSYDVGIPILYGLFDDDFVAKFSGTALASLSQVAAVPYGVFDRDATLIGLYGAN